MAPSRFSKDRTKPREVTPFRDEPPPASIIPLRPTTPGPDRPLSPVDPLLDNRPVTPAPPEWTSYDAPINFTWVIPDELCGMGWPKSRDQVRFLVDQGIDHLVTLSPEKIPPTYAFPDLKHTSIPVEDFTGPTISEIQRFIEITDEARKDGEAVGVHCAEGRGRTGVMCACYLIYYYDMEAWEAIRIMRRQRPGSVERKVQEETVVRFFTLLSDYGKDSVDKLDQREKQLLEMQRKQQAELIRNDVMATQKATMNLLGHMHSFHSKQSTEAKKERVARMRRARSMPKMDDEEEKNLNLKNHLQSFLQGDRQRVKRSKSQARDKQGGLDTGESGADCSDSDRRSRATTPGKPLLEVSLRPPSERNIKNRLDPPKNKDQKCELKNHFRDFMKTPATVRRGRSFSQPRDKDKGSGREENGGCLSRKESFEQKFVSEKDQEKQELENHTKRFLQRKSMIKTIKHSDDSDNDSMSLSVTTLSSNKTVDKDIRDSSCSADELESSPVINTISSKPPLSKPAVPNAANKYIQEANGTEKNIGEKRVRKTSSDNSESKISEVVKTKKQAERRSERRLRSKSDVTGLFSTTETEATNTTQTMNGVCTTSEEKDNLKSAITENIPNVSENTPEIANGHSDLLEETDRTRIRKNNLHSNNEYVYLDTNCKISNSNPRPFNLSRQTSKENEENIFSRQNNIEIDEKEDKKYSRKLSSNDVREKSFSRQLSNDTEENNYPMNLASNEILEKSLTRQCSNDKEEQSFFRKQICNDAKEKSISKPYYNNDKENRRTSKEKIANERRKSGSVEEGATNDHLSTANDFLNSCKSGFRRLTYRKTYSRTKSGNKEVENQERNGESLQKSSQARESREATFEKNLPTNYDKNLTKHYTQMSSGTRVPHRPTTPGPYLGTERPTSPGVERPITPGPFTRESWKRTNHKYNYSRQSCKDTFSFQPFFGL